MASSALAREKPNGQSPRECPGIASSMTAGSFVDTSEDCDEVNLKEETLDDELKVYCVFHSDLVLDYEQDHPMFLFDLSGSPRRRPVRQPS